MVDGKLINHLTQTRNTRQCFLCGLSGADLNDIDGSRPFQINKDHLKFGLTPLHLWIRFLEFILDIRYDRYSPPPFFNTPSLEKIYAPDPYTY